MLAIIVKQAQAYLNNIFVQRELIVNRVLLKEKLAQQATTICMKI